MNIAYSCNDFYVPQTGISIISLLENNKHIDEINIYIISKDISEKNLKILNEICTKRGRIMIVVPFEQIAFDLKLSELGRHVETVYSKIFFSRIEGLQKCLYIDSDTIIIDSLDDLWNTDISDVYLAAVETINVNSRRRLFIKPESPFFNDGMVLVNVDYCRKHQLIEKSLQLIEKFNGSPPILSEGILNSICQDEFKIVSLRYNLMSGMLHLATENPKYLSDITSYSESEITDSCKNPVIIHYLSAFYNRPWSKHCTHPLKDTFLNYKKSSPWSQDELSDEKLPLKLRLIIHLNNIFGFDKIHRLSKFKTKIIK